MEFFWCLFGFFSKFRASFGYRLYYCTYFLGVPKWDPDFGNYTFVMSKLGGARLNARFEI